MPDFPWKWRRLSRFALLMLPPFEKGGESPKAMGDLLLIRSTYECGDLEEIPLNPPFSKGEEQRVSGIPRPPQPCP
jgi:hypothetical protein